MLDHGWLFTCAVLLVFPATVAAQDATASAEGSEAMKRRLRTLEAKYEETGDPTFLFERAMTLEEMGEYAFALEIIEQHREDFEQDPDIDGVAVAEQRLRRHLSDGASGGSGGGDARRDGPGVFGWTLTGVGAATLAGGVTSILVAEHRAKRLRCSPVSDGSGGAGCEGVEPYTELAHEEFDQKSRGVRTLRGVGIGLSLAGVGLAAWGVVRLVSGGRSGASASAARVRPTVGWGRSGAVFGIDVGF